MVMTDKIAFLDKIISGPIGNQESSKVKKIT